MSGIKLAGVLAASFCCLVLIHGVSSAGPLAAVRSFWDGDNTAFCERENQGGLFRTPAKCRDGNFLTFSGSFEEFYRCEAPEGETVASFWKVRVLHGIPLGRDGAHGRLQVGVEDARLFSKIPIEDGKGSVRLSHLQRHWSLAYRRKVAPCFGIGGGIGARADDVDSTHLDGSFRITIEPFAGWKVNAQASRSFQSNPLKARLNEESLDLTTEFGLTHYRAGLTAPLGQWMTVKLTGGGGRLIPDEKTGGYVNRMSADWWEGGLRFLLLPSDTWSISGVFQGGKGTGAQSGRLEGEPFSRLFVKSWWRRFCIDATWRPNNRLSLEASVLKGVWAFRASEGKLESWPFLPGFVSLLGGTDWSLKGNGSLEVARYGAEASFRLTESVELVTSFGFVRLDPEADLVSRERIKTDLITIFLPETRAIESPIAGMNVLDVAFLARWRLGRMGLEYGLTQMVPVRVSREERFEEERRKRNIRKERGGTAHRLTVTCFLKKAKDVK